MNLHHDKEAFAELIIGAANELAIPTNVIEKDYFDCGGVRIHD